jgi:hypothetical protein
MVRGGRGVLRTEEKRTGKGQGKENQDTQREEHDTSTQE